MPRRNRRPSQIRPMQVNVERLEDRFAPAVFDNFNSGASSFIPTFAQNIRGVADDEYFYWGATAGIQDQGGAAGGGVLASLASPPNEQSAIYQPATFNLSDGAVHTVSMFVTAASVSNDTDRTLNIGFITSPTGGFDDDFSYLSVRLLANHQAQFGFCNGSGTNIQDTTTPTGTIATNDWLQLVFTAQEVASGSFTCTYSLLDYGQTGLGVPAVVLAPVTYTVTGLTTIGAGSAMYAGFRYGMSNGGVGPLDYDNFAVDASPANLAIVTQPTIGVVGSPLSTLSVAVDDNNSNVVVGDSSNVTVTLNHGTFSNGQTTATVPAVDGIATFGNLQINTPGSYTLTVTDANSGLGSVVVPIVIGTAPASKLAFVQQPDGGSPGSAINPAVTVAVEDVGGNTIAGDASSVTLTLSSGTFAGGATTATANAVNGVATFSSLAVAAAGSYTLSASDSNLTATTSNPFSIATPVTIYVSNSRFGLGAAPTLGQPVDGDQGTSGTQSAIYGTTAFPDIGTALATVSTSGAIVVNGGAYAESPNLMGSQTLELTAGALSLSTLDTAATATVDLQSNSLTVGVNSTGSDTIAGPIVGTGGSLVKSGSDTLTLSGADTYTGGTTVAAGTLLVTGSVGNVTVAAGATLAGTGAGTLAGAVTSSGTIAPGTAVGSIGTLAVGSLTLSGGILSLDLASSISYDRIAATGVVDLAGAALNLSAVVGNINDNDTFTIITGTSVVGAFTGGSTIVAGTRKFGVQYGSNSVILTALSATNPTLIGNPVLNGGLAYIDSTIASNQHSMVENIVYSFSQAVSLTTSNFTLSGIEGTTTAPNIALASTSGGAVWTVTFTGAGVNNATNSIGDGDYQLLLAGVTGLAASTFDFFRLEGDMDGNGTVDSSDFNILISSFLRGTADPAYLGADDLDGNNKVDGSDFNIFVSNYLKKLPALPKN
jgi:autotransporter-associated beta strand protein